MFTPKDYKDDPEVPSPRKREQKVKLSREPRNYLEAQLEEMYQKIVWLNASFVRDSRRFFALSNQVKNKCGEASLLSTLRYCLEKNKLAPNYVCAALQGQLKRLGDK